MWRDLLLFTPLAIATNTAFPLSFDPVLLYFANGHTLGEGAIFAFVGSLCAGVAGVVDLKVVACVGKLFSMRGATVNKHSKSRWFYVFTLVYAFSPLSFSVVRIASLRYRPNAALYGVCIGLGRLPRYLLTVYFCQSLAVPSWANLLLLLLAISFAVYKLHSSRGSSDATMTEQEG